MATSIKVLFTKLCNLGIQWKLLAATRRPNNGSVRNGVETAKECIPILKNDPENCHLPN